MLRGRWLPRSELDGLLADVARAVRADVKDLPVSEEEARRVAGVYEMPKLPVQMEVGAEKGFLTLVAHDPHGTMRLRLRAQGDGSYRVLEIRAKVTFEIREGRAVALVLAQHGAEVKAERRR
jgi:hypothetical protein